MPDVVVNNEQVKEPESTQGQEPKGYTYGGKTYGTPEELGKAYESVNAELGKWTQQYGDLDKRYKDTETNLNRWNEWWKTIQPLWGQDVEEFLYKKLNGSGQARPAAQERAQAQATAQAIEDAFDGFESLAPREQATRISQHIREELGQAFMGQLANLAKAVNDTLVAKENWYQQYLTNHLGLLRKALEAKFQNPQFDIDKTLEMAAQALGGQIDPLRLGQQLIDASTFEAQLEAAKKAAYEQGRKDFETEAKNKNQEAVPPTVGGPPKYKLPVAQATHRTGLLGRRETAAETIFKKFGPQWFNTR